MLTMFTPLRRQPAPRSRRLAHDAPPSRPQYRTYLKGSSTVCLALMKPNKQLEIANVGDSGVRILRNGKVIFGTEVGWVHCCGRISLAWPVGSTERAKSI